MKTYEIPKPKDKYTQKIYIQKKRKKKSKFITFKTI